MISKHIRRCFSSKVLTKDTINTSLKEMEYAVRGLVPMTAEKIQAELATNSNAYPFKQVLFCNIGNPQSVGQKHISFYRQVTSLCDHPDLLSALLKDKSKLKGLPYDEYTLERAAQCLDDMKVGTGAYSHSKGVMNFRKDVAQFIMDRDGYASNENDIFLTNGASSGIQMLLTAMLASSSSGLLIPVPQYPIYSALTRLLDGKFVGYYLDEEKNWGLDFNELNRAYDEAQKKGVDIRGIVVINPGNPTGNVLSYEDIETVVRFCKEKKVVLMADEVYQENIYGDRPFVSVKKVLKDLGPEFDSVEVASFHSTSKGFIGECGKRGGYMELTNFDEEVSGELLKLASSGLCSNLIGQLVTSLMVKGPPAGSSAYEQFCSERDAILGSLKRKSKMVYEKLNAIEGVSCQSLDGAMYAFPNIQLSKKFINDAKSANRHPDVHYALSLLQHTGLCAVPGSGFSQKDGTYHVRLTFLPSEEKLEKAMDDFADHHRKTQ